MKDQLSAGFMPTKSSVKGKYLPLVYPTEVRNRVASWENCLSLVLANVLKPLYLTL